MKSEAKNCVKIGSQTSRPVPICFGRKRLSEEFELDTWELFMNVKIT